MVRVKVELSLEDVITICHRLEGPAGPEQDLASRIYRAARVAITKSQKAEKTSESTGPAPAAG